MKYKSLCYTIQSKWKNDFPPALVKQSMLQVSHLPQYLICHKLLDRVCTFSCIQACFGLSLHAKKITKGGASFEIGERSAKCHQVFGSSRC